MADVSRRQRGAACLRDACNLGVTHVYRSARLLSGGGHRRSLQRGRAVEGEHAVFEVFFEEPVECGRERLPSASSSQSTPGGSGMLRISADNRLVSRTITL